jgi:hypothetical protein
MPDSLEEAMLCQRCQREMESEEVREHSGRAVCEDCYMDLLSPARACDSWAVYTATRLNDQVLNPAQEAVLALFNRQGWADYAQLKKATGLDGAALDRELAAMRHSELLRAFIGPDGEKRFTHFANKEAGVH